MPKHGWRSICPRCDGQSGNEPGTIDLCDDVPVVMLAMNKKLPGWLVDLVRQATDDPSTTLEDRT